MIQGVLNFGCTVESTGGSRPSRAITKKIRVWPYIISRTTDGRAMVAASATTLPKKGWPTSRRT